MPPPPKRRAATTAAKAKKTPPPARRRPLRLDVDERRAQLVALGLEHFGSTAYDDVSIDAIAAAADISKGLLYHYFPTKKAYYVAVVREAAAQLVAACDAPSEEHPLVQLHEGIDAYLSFVKDKALAYATLMRSGVGVDPEIGRIVDDTRATLTDRLTAGFALASAAEPSSLRLDLASPMIRLALRGWIGFAEASSLGWSESLAAGLPAPTQAEMRSVLANALVAIVQSASSVPSASSR
ncbi:MAG: TetR/AcrR family transcriptional regulator [Deltaproteobacteria bacterium]|nr:TetR/AcrR family transcriptional regulator [Deltaproteobacteria bacterium]